MATTNNLKLNVPAVPVLPIATTAYSQQQQNQYTNTLRLYFNQLNGVVAAVVGNEGGQYLSFPYGAFQDNTTQTAAATSTPYAVKFGTTDLTNSVTVVTDGTNLTRVTVDETGIYNFAFSLQLAKATANSKTAWIWPRINGSNVADSATKVTLSGNGSAVVAAWNFFLSMSAGDYFQLMWAVEDTGIQIVHDAATAFCPEIPSAILTVNFISVPPTNSSVV